MRKIILVAVIIAGIASMATTFLQVQPSLFIIEKVMDSSGRFSITMVLGLTFLLYALPILLISFLVSFIKTAGNKKDVVDVTIDGSGIIVERSRALYGVAFALEIVVNDEKKGSVMMGKKLAISLPDGTHKVHVISMKHLSEPIHVEIGAGEAKQLVCGFEPGGTMKDVYIREKI
jgi:hypothetical protein